MLLIARAISRATPIVPQRSAPFCRLTTPVVKGRCARDALPHTFNMGVCLNPLNNSVTIEHIYDESANIIVGCNVAFDDYDSWNFQ